MELTGCVGRMLIDQLALRAVNSSLEAGVLWWRPEERKRILTVSASTWSIPKQKNHIINAMFFLGENHNIIVLTKFNLF